MLNPTAWDMAGKAAFVWAGTACLVWISCYFYLPECKDRSFRELDILFHRKVPARQFATTVVNDEDEA
jgi:SP family general alpha glucoside:H+ symporter-like MFS transporter